MSARSHVDEDGQEGDVVLVGHTVDAKELARLYVGERLTAEEVAKRIGCSETTVRRRLRSQALNVRSRGPRRREPATVGWTRERAYAIGLLATDGNLSRDGRHLTVTSADPDLLVVLRACLALQANVRQVGPQGRCYRVQWSDRRLYEWVEIVDWFRASLLRFVGIRGSISERMSRAGHPYWVLRYDIARILGGMVPVHVHDDRSIAIDALSPADCCPGIYYAPSIPCLARKRARSEPFLRLTRTS